MRLSMSLIAALASTVVVSSASAEQYRLLTGVDAGFFPGAPRTVFANPGPPIIPGTFEDGDRLAGTADVGAAATWNGSGTPLYSPNQFGSLSFMYRRGSVPAGPAGQIPLMGIEFLGGPLLDLDGNLGNGSRSLTPTVNPAVAIPNSSSYVGLSLDVGGGQISLNGFDATGTNEGANNLLPGNGVTVNTLAGTTPLGGLGGAINPGVDTRSGTLTAYSGTSTTLNGVFRIEDLGFELWQDPIEPTSSGASTLGGFQYLGGLRGWVIERDGGGSFPTLAGEGLGSTLWPTVSTSHLGAAINTSSGIPPTSTIVGGSAGDLFAMPNNGGLPLADFGGDLGAYLDAVVLPLVDPLSQRVVFLEAAGFGINNSFDPVFGDSIGYDVVLIAQSPQVPEPMTALLLAGGGVLVRRRRAL